MITSRFISAAPLGEVTREAVIQRSPVGDVGWVLQSLVHIAGLQSPKSNNLAFGVDLV